MYYWRQVFIHFFLPVENTCSVIWFISVFPTSGITRNKSLYGISPHGLKYCISLEKTRVMHETQVFQVSIQIMPMILDFPTQWSTLMRDSLLVLHQEKLGHDLGWDWKRRWFKEIQNDERKGNIYSENNSST